MGSTSAQVIEARLGEAAVVVAGTRCRILALSKLVELKLASE